MITFNIVKTRVRGLYPYSQKSRHSVVRLSEYLNQLLKSEELLKEKTYFLTGMPSKIKKWRPEKIRHPKSFPNFLIEEKNIDFRDFLYELEIAETFENATTDTSIRYQNLRLKKYAFFWIFLRI